MGHSLAISGIFLALFGAIAGIAGKEHWIIAIAAGGFGFVCVAATQVIWSARHRSALINMLRIDRPPQLYQRALTRVLAPVLRFFGVPFVTPIKSPVRQIVRDTFSYQLLDRALLLAVAYPMLLLFAQWVGSGTGQLGEVIVFPTEPNGWIRALFTILILLILFSPVASKLASASPQRFVRRFADWLPVLFFAGAF